MGYKHDIDFIIQGGSIYEEVKKREYGQKNRIREKAQRTRSPSPSQIRTRTPSPPPRPSRRRRREDDDDDERTQTSRPRLLEELIQGGSHCVKCDQCCMCGGALKAKTIKKVIDLSYKPKSNKAPKGYELDKDISNKRVKVYKKKDSNEALVVHRGSQGIQDWVDNARYAFGGQMKSTDTYKKHKKKHQKAIDKYGADNIIAVGHSRGGKYVEELNKSKPVKEVITYNKAVAPVDIRQKNPKNQTDIRTTNDVVSFLGKFQKSKNPVVTIPSNTINPIKAHSSQPLKDLGEELIGKGFANEKERFNIRSLPIKDLRKLVKAYKKDKGETDDVKKMNKKELQVLAKPILQELNGGSLKGFKKFWKGAKPAVKLGTTGLAMAASTHLTGNPMLGKTAADVAWRLGDKYIK